MSEITIAEGVLLPADVEELKTLDLPRRPSQCVCRYLRHRQYRMLLFNFVLDRMLLTPLKTYLHLMDLSLPHHTL